MHRAPSAYLALVETAARRYAPAGRFATHFARGKLRHDPVFAAILAQDLIPRDARLIDLGCGQGVLLALLVAAEGAAARGAWPAEWPPAPRLASMTGFELLPHAVARARAALGDRAHIEQADLRTIELPACDAIALIDVLHYVDAAAQEVALAKCARALPAGGVLFLRVGDAGAGWRFALTRVADQIASFGRSGSWPMLYARPVREWVALLERSGFDVRSQPASEGTPFANALLVGRRR